MSAKKIDFNFSLVLVLERVASILEILADLATHIPTKSVGQLVLLADLARRLLPAASKPRFKSLAVAACCSLTLMHARAESGGASIGQVRFYQLGFTHDSIDSLDSTKNQLSRSASRGLPSHRRHVDM